MLERGEIIFSDTADLPQPQKEFMLVQAIHSILLVPIVVEQSCWGFIGFDECVAAREWLVAERDALRPAAEIVAAAIQRDKTESALRESEARLRAVVSNAPIFVTDRHTDAEFLVVAPNTDQAIIIPLKSRSGQVLGTLAVESTGVPRLTTADFSLLTLLADQVSVAVENARLFADLQSSERRYRALVAQAGDSIVLADSNGRLLAADPCRSYAVAPDIDESGDQCFGSDWRSSGGDQCAYRSAIY